MNYTRHIDQGDYLRFYFNPISAALHMKNSLRQLYKPCFIFSRFVWFYDLSQTNKIEDKDEARVMTSWLCANWRTDQSLDDEEKLSHLGLKFKEIKFVIERWIGFVLKVNVIALLN